MSIDLERELRDEMERAPIRPRPNLVREAHRRFRRRRLATRAALAAGTAVAVSVATVIAVTGLPGQQRIETTAYVISQMNNALAAANGDVMHISQDGIDGTTGSTPNPESIQYWAYGSQSRELLTYDGSKLDTWDTLTHVKQGFEDSVVSADYHRRTVVKGGTIFPHVPTQAVGGCYGIPGGLLDSPGTGLIESASLLADTMHALVHCGSTSVAWHQRFDGTQAIELTGHYGNTTWHVWIDEATFLPIADGFSSPNVDEGSSTERYGWLVPTAANLAMLTGPIPPGFTVTTHPPAVQVSVPHLKPAGPPALPTVWGTGPAAAIARRMGATLSVTGREILAERQVVTGSPSVARVASTWIYPGNVRTHTLSGAGKPQFDSTIITTLVGHDRIKQISTMVDYVHKQVLRDVGGGAAGVWNPGLPTPSRVCLQAAEGQDPVASYAGAYSPQFGAGDSEAVLVRDLLACPHVSVTISPQQRFNGAEAIKISWPRPRQHSTDTFWLDSSTYALIGVTSATDPGYHQRQGSVVFGTSAIQLRWLPPTKANLALLNLYVPPSFAGAS
jgi:hypothetical protein